MVFSPRLPSKASFSYTYPYRTHILYCTIIRRSCSLKSKKTEPIITLIARAATVSDSSVCRRSSIYRDHEDNIILYLLHKSAVKRTHYSYCYSTETQRNTLTTFYSITVWQARAFSIPRITTAKPPLLLLFALRCSPSTTVTTTTILAIITVMRTLPFSFLRALRSLFATRL